LPQTSAAPPPFKRLIAAAGFYADATLPGRFKGKFARILGLGGARYLAPRVAGSDDLLRRLNSRGIRYAVINAMEGLGPALIVDDEDVRRMTALVSPWPTGESVTAYSPGGLPGFAHGDMPFLPPRLARRVLDGATEVNGISTASMADCFFVSLYRWVYLEAPLPGEPDALPTEAISEHAGRLGLELPKPISRQTLDTFLSEHDWQPPLDMQERIGCWNTWVADKLRALGEWVGSEPPGLTVFYLRQRALDENKGERILETIRASGFRVLPTPALSAQQLAQITAEVRGGNWGRGPFPLSGGNPGAVYVAHDAMPIVPDEKTLSQFPLLDDSRIQLAKQAVRDVAHKGLPRQQRYNAMHSTDNAVQAWRAVREYYPGMEAELRAIINVG
jgi:hypothetical protein